VGARAGLGDAGDEAACVLTLCVDPCGSINVAPALAGNIAAIANSAAASVPIPNLPRPFRVPHPAFI
jgi:hypothetical protein